MHATIDNLVDNPNYPAKAAALLMEELALSVPGRKEIIERYEAKTGLSGSRVLLPSHSAVRLHKNREPEFFYLDAGGRFRRISEWAEENDGKFLVLYINSCLWGIPETKQSIVVAPAGMYERLAHLGDRESRHAIPMQMFVPGMGVLPDTEYEKPSDEFLRSKAIGGKDILIAQARAFGRKAAEGLALAGYGL